MSESRDQIDFSPDSSGDFIRIADTRVETRVSAQDVPLEGDKPSLSLEDECRFDEFEAVRLRLSGSDGKLKSCSSERAELTDFERESVAGSVEATGKFFSVPLVLDGDDIVFRNASTGKELRLRYSGGENGAHVWEAQKIMRVELGKDNGMITLDDGFSTTRIRQDGSLEMTMGEASVRKDSDGSLEYRQGDEYIVKQCSDGTFEENYKQKDGSYVRIESKPNGDIAEFKDGERTVRNLNATDNNGREIVFVEQSGSEIFARMSDGVRKVVFIWENPNSREIEIRLFDKDFDHKIVGKILEDVLTGEVVDPLYSPIDVDEWTKEYLVRRAKLAGFIPIVGTT